MERSQNNVNVNDGDNTADLQREVTHSLVGLTDKEKFNMHNNGSDGGLNVRMRRGNL